MKPEVIAEHRDTFKQFAPGKTPAEVYEQLQAEAYALTSGDARAAVEEFKKLSPSQQFIAEIAGQDPHSLGADDPAHFDEAVTKADFRSAVDVALKIYRLLDELTTKGTRMTLAGLTLITAIMQRGGENMGSRTPRWSETMVQLGSKALVTKLLMEEDAAAELERRRAADDF